MRTFETGATRDNVEGKLSYMRALSPAVLKRYVEYLAQHRKQADRQMRAFDNWKKGIPQETYMDSLLRHTFDAWRMFVGCLPGAAPRDLEDLLCAVIFNASGMLFEELVQADPGSQREHPADPIEAEYDKGIEAMVGPPPAEPKTCGECAKQHKCDYGQAHPTDKCRCSVYTPKVPA